MVLSQYGRFLAYVQCAISGIVDPGAPCDCEKQVPPEVRGDARDLPPPKGMNVSFEEYYLPAHPYEGGAPSAATEQPRYGPAADYTFSSVTGVFRPPRA